MAPVQPTDAAPARPAFSELPACVQRYCAYFAHDRAATPEEQQAARDARALGYSVTAADGRPELGARVYDARVIYDRACHDYTAEEIRAHFPADPAPAAEPAQPIALTWEELPANVRRYLAERATNARLADTTDAVLTPEEDATWSIWTHTFLTHWRAECGERLFRETPANIRILAQHATAPGPAGDAAALPRAEETARVPTPGTWGLAEVPTPILRLALARLDHPEAEWADTHAEAWCAIPASVRGEWPVACADGHWGVKIGRDANGGIATASFDAAYARAELAQRDAAKPVAGIRAGETLTIGVRLDGADEVERQVARLEAAVARLDAAQAALAGREAPAVNVQVDGSVFDDRAVAASFLAELDRQAARRGLRMGGEAMTKPSDTFVGQAKVDAPAPTVMETLKVDASEAGWRVAGSQFVALVREPLAALLARHLAPDDDAFRGRVSEFLKTELGAVMVGGLLSLGLQQVPGDVATRMARELRIASAARAGDVLAGLLTGPLLAATSGLLAGAPQLAAVPAALPAAEPARAAVGERAKVAR